MAQEDPIFPLAVSGRKVISWRVSHSFQEFAALVQRNQNLKPFIWTAKTFDILQKVTRAQASIR
jgi:hypothetical protein